MDVPRDVPRILTIYLQIAQYPILAQHIRQRMREELFQRGVISPSRLEQEVRDKAVQSQMREGLSSPLLEEDARQWEQRLQFVRDNLTDFYFAYNLPMALFYQILEQLLAERRVEHDLQRETNLNFNPELAPVGLLLHQAERYEALPEDARSGISHHLEEILVVLIKSMISDQLGLVRVAKSVLTSADFRMIERQRIGSGKIGGKAGGLLVSWKILQKAAAQIAQRIALPRSYYIGADVFYDFLALNGLEFMNQKYKNLDQIRAEYPQIQEAYARGRFPEEIADRLRSILCEAGKAPLVVRSSSLLEDSFGSAFAGKYASFFCPNQGTPKENLRDLTLAIRRVYASVYSPDALTYRRRVGLLDYDERMAILLQDVQGETYRKFFFPILAGVAYSISPVVWNPRLRREDGFARLVLGLGTRDVERIGDDYPRLVALSHPSLRPEVTPKAKEYYSQRSMDVIDLEENKLVSRRFSDVLGLDYPALQWVASVRGQGTLMPMYGLLPGIKPDDLVLTFDNLLQQTDFVPHLKKILSTLSLSYGAPVDIEFAVTHQDNGWVIHLLQCRVQTGVHGGTVRPLPKDIPQERTLFIANRMVPQGEIDSAEYIVHVDPLEYHQLAKPSDRFEVARIVGRLNRLLEGRCFVLVGPGRWGTFDIELGIPVTYADIYNASALIEVAVPYQGTTPEPSYGTHFFQDLVEQRIYPIAVFPSDRNDFLNWDYLSRADSVLRQLLPEVAATYEHLIKVIHVPTTSSGSRLVILMNGEQALAYFSTAGRIPGDPQP